ncbi:glycosyltransferase [Marinobacterium sp. AK62]|uniref:Glycosyltransferase n=1 Tax=Marinobacterium alkalitolerans TaxID=1542925 RepID=A0ABS3ZEJ3_9GAMM|nr:glycosyltransferase [Marinobacterium alkalitolerans]MBP0049708.1 glycosyltransferase [Marinobacterium alkalitolerans]
MATFISALARCTSSKANFHRVLVFTREKQLRVECWPCGTEVFFCPMWFQVASMPVGPAYLKKFWQLLDWADVLHFHYPFPLQDLIYLGARLIRKMPPAVVTYHSDIIRQRWFRHFYFPMAKCFLKTVEYVVATSPQYLSTSHMLQHIDAVEIIPLGISEAHYPSVSEERQRYYERRIGKGFFLFLGALRYYKGLDWLVDAARLTGLPVVIAGGGQMSNNLAERARGVSNLYLLGEVDEVDKIALLSLAKAFVFPSHLRSEAFGISLLEAQMMNLPLITCEIGTGTSYVNRHKVTGLVVPPEDATAIGEAMVFLASNSDVCKSMGAAAYARYKAMFTAEQMSERYLGLYSRAFC